MSSFLPHSVRWRLQLWLALLLACVLGGFGSAIYPLERADHFNRIDGELDVRVAALTRVLRNSPLMRDPVRPSGYRGEHEPPEFGGRGRGGMRGGNRGQRPPGLPPDGPPPELEQGTPDSFDGPPRDFRPEFSLPAETAALFGQRSGDYYYTAWYRDGSVLSSSAAAPTLEVNPREQERDTLTHWQTRQQYREAFHCSGFGDCVLAGRSIQTDLAAMRNFGWILFGAGAGVFGIGLGVGWQITMSVVRPIERISAAASRISHGNLRERVQGTDSSDEIGQLAAVLNSTFGRLESAFARQRQFTGDAAHELRTPLAVIISEAQTTLARERNAGEYRETVEGCLATAQEMRKLTESLLEFARLDDGNTPLTYGRIDLSESALSCVKRIAPLAARHGIRIHTQLKSVAARTVGDSLDQVITNLLINAVLYNKPDGEIWITTSADAGAAALIVADSGIGISQMDLFHIFERFYRVDKARSRAQGSSGLGLAICKSIVEASGGTITVVSEPNTGTTFIVRLPLSSG